MANRSGGPARGDKTHFGERATEHGAAAKQPQQDRGRESSAERQAHASDKTHLGTRGTRK